MRKIHERKLAHCDIKLENILYNFSPRIFRLSDFSLARKLYPVRAAYDYAMLAFTIWHLLWLPNILTFKDYTPVLAEISQN